MGQINAVFKNIFWQVVITFVLVLIISIHIYHVNKNSAFIGVSAFIILYALSGYMIYKSIPISKHIHFNL